MNLYAIYENIFVFATGCGRYVDEFLYIGFCLCVRVVFVKQQTLGALVPKKSCH